MSTQTETPAAAVASSEAAAAHEFAAQYLEIGLYHFRNAVEENEKARAAAQKVADGEMSLTWFCGLYAMSSKKAEAVVFHMAPVAEAVRNLVAEPAKLVETVEWVQGRVGDLTDRLLRNGYGSSTSAYSNAEFAAQRDGDYEALQGYKLFLEAVRRMRDALDRKGCGMTPELEAAWLAVGPDQK